MALRSKRQTFLETRTSRWGAAGRQRRAVCRCRRWRGSRDRSGRKCLAYRACWLDDTERDRSLGRNLTNSTTSHSKCLRIFLAGLLCNGAVLELWIVNELTNKGEIT